jgi:heterotetrameric sarcosine oxidase gamma subunit
MFDLAAAPAFTGMTSIGSGEGLRVRLIAPAISSVLVRAGKMDALIDKAQAVFGLALTDGPQRSTAEEVSALGIGPGRYLFLGVETEAVAAHFSGLASISDHADGYAVFSLCGPQVRDVLAKGVALDLEACAPSDVAVTSIAHIGAILWSTGDDTFVVAVFRSYAGSFWHWLVASAGEFGLVVEDAP